jgi:hypothetical protein
MPKTTEEREKHRLYMREYRLNKMTEEQKQSERETHNRYVKTEEGHQAKLKASKNYHAKIKDDETYKQKQIALAKKYNRTERGLQTRRVRIWKNSGMRCNNWDALYERYLETPNCECCNKDISTEKRSLDHDHLSGYPRYIVCNTCNTKLGVVDRLRNVLHLELHRYFLRK